MKVIAVAVPKGGVGKTTTAVNLAARLSAAGQRVHLLDLDPHASATFALGSHPIQHLLTGDLVRLEGERFSLHPGGMVLARASAGESLSVIRHAAVGADLLVIDTQPALSSATLAALKVASIVIAPVEPAWLSLPALDELTAALQTIKAASRLRIVLSRVRVVRRLTREIAGTIAGRYPGALYPVAVPEDVRAAETLPVRDPQSKAGAAFDKLSQWLLADVT
ncbi:MAG TPA: AAA family ATPase [Longimicrobiaceae bacterium]|nr:AAA family ATPase [Longimicrobiaceae bacterium]